MGSQQEATFGQALRIALAEARYTQAKLAEELGIDPGQVSRWVNDKAIPHVGTVGRIEAILDADLSIAFEASRTAGYELYVSAPITGLPRRATKSHNESIQLVVSSLREQVNSVYWPGEENCLVSRESSAHRLS